jgi:DNA replication and repair protein RecF
VRIRELRAEGWRNLEPLTLVPGERLSVLHGDNGQGKTNVIEAAYYLAVLRSFRTSHADDLIRKGTPATTARLRAEILHRGLERRFEIDLRPTGRVARLDGKTVRGTAAALGAVSVVLFVPEDLLLPRAAPATRRRFLDLAIFNIERGYYDEASAYQKVLKNRNVLLKRGPPDPILLDTYDEELARTGARVVMRRRGLVAALTPLFAGHFRALHSELPVSLAYTSDPDVARADDEEAVRAALQAGLAARRGWTNAGGSRASGPTPTTWTSALPARQRAATRRRASCGRWCSPSSWPSYPTSRRASAIRPCCSWTTSRASSIPRGAPCCST